MDYESVLLVKNEVFVYQLPPRQSNRGYRANDWGLDSPFWTGRLKVVAVGQDLIIRLEDRNTGQLFANCPVKEFPGIAIESVLDSSRYFVIRLVHDNGRTVFMGLGFTERIDSFDLNLAIQDHFKHVKQEKEAELNKESAAARPPIDFSIKEGEKIKLNFNTRLVGDKASQKTKPTRVCGLSPGGGLLPPPPPANSRSRGNRTTTAGQINNGSLSVQPESTDFDLTNQIPQSNRDLWQDMLDGEK